MIQAGKAYLSKVPVEVEVTVADNWAEKQKKHVKTNDVPRRSRRTTEQGRSGKLVYKAYEEFEEFAEQGHAGAQYRREMLYGFAIDYRSQKDCTYMEHNCLTMQTGPTWCGSVGAGAKNPGYPISLGCYIHRIGPINKEIIYSLIK